jgi:hypothetical protein
MAGDKTNAKLDEILNTQVGDSREIKEAWKKFIDAVK